MIMTIFNIGDVVVPTEDGIKRYAFLITSGRYKVLQATPTGELNIQNVKSGTKITGLRKEFFKHDSPQTASVHVATFPKEKPQPTEMPMTPASAPKEAAEKPPLAKIVIRKYEDTFVASCGAFTCSVPATKSFAEGADMALKALFAKMSTPAYLNAKICIIDGNDVLKTGHMYIVADGKLKTSKGIILERASLKTLADLENYINTRFNHEVTYIVVNED